MKLYATTTSERASKGQGGEYLDIEIKDENKHTFAIIKVHGDVVTIWHSGERVFNVYKVTSMKVQKGKSQKGELCAKCLDKGIKNYNPCKHDTH